MKNYINNVLPKKTSDLTNDSGFITSAPVSSVNEQTGAVVLSIPSKVSDLTNDSGFVGSASVTSIWTGTQAQYEALTPDANTLYFIQEV